MKNNAVLMLACCFLLWSNPVAKANHTDPVGVVEMLPDCNLPAPANLQYTQPTPYTVQFTWDAVPGAVGYRSVLMNLSNGSQSITFGAPPNANFPVIPGDDYLFFVAAMCSLDPPRSSNDTSEVSFRAGTIIIDLVVDLPNCTPDEEVPDSLPFNDVNNMHIFDHDWTLPVNQYYYIELAMDDDPEKVRLAFKYVESSNAAPSFELRGLESNPAGWELSGQTSTGNYQNAPVNNISNAMVTYAGRTCRIAFPVANQLSHYVLPGETPFDEFRVFGRCRGKGGEGGGGKRSDMEGDDWISNHFSGNKVLTINPFSSDLIIYFNGSPAGPVKTRLFDLQGIPKIETVIEPDQMSDSGCALPTGSLQPGMYFLHMEMPSGEVIVRKVLKI